MEINLRAAILGSVLVLMLIALPIGSSISGLLAHADNKVLSYSNATYTAPCGQVMGSASEVLGTGNTVGIINYQKAIVIKVNKYFPPDVVIPDFNVSGAKIDKDTGIEYVQCGNYLYRTNIEMKNLDFYYGSSSYTEGLTWYIMNNPYVAIGDNNGDDNWDDITSMLVKYGLAVASVAAGAYSSAAEALVELAATTYDIISNSNDDRFNYSPQELIINLYTDGLITNNYNAPRYGSIINIKIEGIQGWADSHSSGTIAHISYGAQTQFHVKYQKKKDAWYVFWWSTYYEFNNYLFAHGHIYLKLVDSPPIPETIPLEINSTSSTVIPVTPQIASFIAANG
ncbi:MAG: hypothetical protein F7C35_03665 [Desulfurococcales archaeon]|nr:hypothetical protein [Desulfurococcales archaeon]